MKEDKRSILIFISKYFRKEESEMMINTAKHGTDEQVESMLYEAEEKLDNRS